ncbi:MAG: adenylyl-sulfate kinase [Nitrososphaerales archaeon]
MKTLQSGYVIWFTGLPGSGKSSIAKKVIEKLDTTLVYLSMDEIRKQIFEKPNYSDQERDIAYRALVLVAEFACISGANVVVDATAHKRIWRDLARKRIQNFVEVYVKCPVDTCIERETKRESDLVRKRIYVDALERLRSGKVFTELGKVPGVDEPYEESKPEIVIDSSKGSIEEEADQIIDQMEKYAPLAKFRESNKG